MVLLSLQMMLPYLRSSASSLSLSIVLPFMFIFSFIFMPNPSSAQVHCSISLFNCGGNYLDIRYPFWTEPSPDYCRYLGKDFEITCSDDHVAQIEIATHKFHVAKIDYETQTATIVDMDFFNPSSDLCPFSFPYYKPLDFNHFQYSNKDRNLTLLYNCPYVEIQSFHLVPCLSSGGTGYAYLTNESRIPDPLKKCETKMIPILASELEMNMTLLAASPQDVIEMGFEVTWSPIDPSFRCRDCSRSGGHCRYNDAQPQQPSCYCNGQLHYDTCPRDDRPNLEGDARPNLKRKIIIGACAGIGGFLLCVVIFISIWVYRKKYYHPSSTLLSRAISFDPSFKSDIEKSNSPYPTQFFNYKELEEATNNFDPSRELGDGGFGTVYHGMLHDGRSVAVKRLYESNYRRVEQFKNEINILSHLRHQNLVTLYGCSSRHSRELLLVYEYIPNGTVADHLHGDRVKPGALTWPIRMSIAIETADALKYLHAVEIIHRDVKTNNILLDNNFGVKVADFGLSRLFPTDVTHVSTAPQGTPGYVDPDYHRCYQLTDKSDVYSFGVVMIELISSKPAVDISRHRYEINLANMAINKIHNHALHELVDPTLGFDSDYEVKRMITLVAELAFRCLQDEKDIRPSMEEVLDTLNGIKNDGYKVEKAEDVGTPADDAVLLKNFPPLSPDTVTGAWESRTTTPNTSG